MPLYKNTEKYIRSLSQKKFRQLHNRFIGEGDKLVKEILLNQHIKIEILLALEEWYEENEHLVKSRPLKVQIITEKELQKISQLKNPNQVLVVAEQFCGLRIGKIFVPFFAHTILPKFIIIKLFKLLWEHFCVFNFWKLILNI